MFKFTQFLEDDNPQKDNRLFQLELTSSRNDELKILVDHLKLTNDTFGHAAGKKLLQRAAAV